MISVLLGFVGTILVGGVIYAAIEYFIGISKSIKSSNEIRNLK